MNKFVLMLLLSLSFFSVVKGQQELPIGSTAPNFAATDHLSKEIVLKDLLQEGPVVLTFYRGEWCPHCNNYMRNLQDSLAMISTYKASVIAITPESEMYIEESVEKSGATFSIVWDEGHRIMDDYQVTFRLGNSKNAIYKMGGINVSKASGSDHRMLPVPATYIIDTKGIIRGSFYNEDYSLRMPVRDILAVLEKISNPL